MSCVSHEISVCEVTQWLYQYGTKDQICLAHCPTDTRPPTKVALTQHQHAADIVPRVRYIAAVCHALYALVVDHKISGECRHALTVNHMSATTSQGNHMPAVRSHSDALTHLLLHQMLAMSSQST